MGCDGGTIPRRDELVRLKKKPEQKDKDAELAFKWKHCTIKQLPLQPPIVSCGLGKLYSKEAVIEGLLDRSILPETAVHIKTLKDVKSLNLTPNPAYDETKIEKGDSIGNRSRSPYICPVIGLEMTGKYKFCFLWTCGCVMSERALKQVKTTICHRCQTPFQDSDVVIINAEGDDLDLMNDNIRLRKANSRSEKKSKKRANSQVETKVKEENDEQVNDVNNDSNKNDVEKEANEAEESLKSSKTSVPTCKSSKNDVINAKNSSKKIKTEHKSSSRGHISNSGSSSSSRHIGPQDPAFEKVKDDYSVAKDPNASEVLKSIFTSHKSANEQTRAHWVTYNPFYN